MENIVPRENPWQQRRDQAEAVADMMKVYCGRVLDEFFSNQPETIFQEAMAAEVCVQPCALYCSFVNSNQQTVACILSCARDGSTKHSNAEYV
jgi:hypothetical protein